MGQKESSSMLTQYGLEKGGGEDHFQTIQSQEEGGGEKKRMEEKR